MNARNLQAIGGGPKYLIGIYLVLGAGDLPRGKLLKLVANLIVHPEGIELTSYTLETRRR